MVLIVGQEGEGFPVELDGKFYYDINGAINHTYPFKNEDKDQYFIFIEFYLCDRLFAGKLYSL